MEAIKISIGIRASSDVIYFSIVEGNSKVFQIKKLDKINLPKGFEIPEQLKFVRATLGDIINENRTKYACLRAAEHISANKNISRMYIEGVIQELIASSTIEKYYIGHIASISAKLNIDRASFKEYVKNKDTFMGIENWSQFCAEQKESIMAALSALVL